MTFSKADLKELEHLYRINLVNSCSGFKSANLIGTTSKSGQQNVTVFSSVTHIGSNPPLLGFFCRPTTVIRHTYNNIKETGVYTINHIHKSIIEDAHHTSASYDETISEFDVTNLTSEIKENCIAPFVKDSPVQLEMKFITEYPIKENGTILVIGEIQHIHVNQDIIEADGFLNLSKANVASINGLDTYLLPVVEKRLDYQRPKSL
ncbi:flavin reductase family protein [Aurantibacter sp.]|uniref:flavin reductase family protein n=1 Tax=Aurantibacter sp. TaxID=2807103 RepID=UPI0035C86C87